MNTTILSVLLISSILLVGCGTSPKTYNYILNSIERDTVPAMTAQNIVIKVGPVSIPDALDQDPIVSRTGTNSLLADDYHRWSGDYRDDIQRVLGENISILLPKSHIALGQEIMLLPEDFQVIINIREFYGQLGGSVILNVDWAVARRGKNKSVIVKKSVLQENTSSADYADYVATQSRLLAKLSQQIAEEIGGQLKK